MSGRNGIHRSNAGRRAVPTGQEEIKFEPGGSLRVLWGI